jgi:lipoprotein-releasing system ATP-binding protein
MPGKPPMPEQVETVASDSAQSPEPKTQNPVILECRNLSRTFQSGDTQLHVLRNVDFQLYDGEIAGILGSSGAGKSTLLHLLGLLDTPTQGEVFYRGRNLTRLGAEAAARVRNKEFGFVFQSFHLLPEFTAL